jgi:hypothetical protein
VEGLILSLFIIIYFKNQHFVVDLAVCSAHSHEPNILVNATIENRGRSVPLAEEKRDRYGNEILIRR